MAEKQDTTLFEFTWGNTFGLFSEGYHLVVKVPKERLYLSYSVDLKYGEIRFDEEKLEELWNDLVALHIHLWSGRTFSNSDFEEGDTWTLTYRYGDHKLEAKGANAYPPEWTELLNYFHIKYSIPVSRREDPTLPKPKRSESKEPPKKQKPKKEDGKHQGTKDGKKREAGRLDGKPKQPQKGKSRTGEAKHKNPNQNPEEAKAGEARHKNPNPEEAPAKNGEGRQRNRSRHYRPRKKPSAPEA